METLNKLFGSKEESDKTTLKQRLYGLKLNESVKMVDHISRFHSLLNQLAGINEKVNDDDAKAIILNSFPKKMSHMVFTLRKIKIGLEGVVSTLLNQNEPLEPEEEVLYVHTKASMSSKKGRYNSKHIPTKGKIKCYYCK